MQLTLQQHGFELHRSTYMWIFLSSKYYSNTQPTVGWTHRQGTMDAEESHVWRANYIIHWFSAVLRVGTPHSHVIQVSPLFIIEHLRAEFWSARVDWASKGWFFEYLPVSYSVKLSLEEKNKDLMFLFLT